MRKKTTARSPIKPAPKKKVKFVLEKGESSKGPDENVEVTEITWGVRGKRSSSSAQVRGPVVDVVDEQPVQTTTRKWKDIDAYGSPSGLQRLIGQLNEKQKDDIKEINFGGLLTLKLTQFYQGMVPFLLGAYHPKSRRFHVDDNKECFLTVYDVYDVFMLPCDTGKKVIVATNKKSDKHHMEYVQLWRDKFGLAPNKELSGEIVASEILKLKDGGTTSKAPKAHKNVDLHLVPSVKDVGEIGTFDWYAYVLEELGDAVSKWRSKDLKNVGGCMLFLQLVYFHRLTWQSLKASSEIPLIQHWDTKHLRTRVEEERKAAEEMKGRYGLGEWDTTTYPIGRERILVAKKEKIPIIELSQSGHGRTVTYRVPDDLLTNEEIRQQAKNECEVDSMLIKRDQEIHSRLTIERVTRIKMNALKLSEKEKEKETAGEENGVGDISFTQLVADDEVMRSCDDLVARMMEATNAAKEMPSFDLGINDEGFNRFRNISPPRKNMGLVRVRVRRKNGGNKKT